MRHPGDYTLVVPLNCPGDAAQIASGTLDWQWDGSASHDGFIAYLYAHYNRIDIYDHDSELAAYLLSVGENPNDYLEMTI